MLVCDGCVGARANRTEKRPKKEDVSCEKPENVSTNEREIALCASLPLPVSLPSPRLFPPPPPLSFSVQVRRIVDARALARRDDDEDDGTRVCACV